ncbi:hypothetical protein CYMTET_47464 [Cymbomonas tetramitiformis]|uniref:Fibronectin type-III domain-containing protein n=1 Tax=Cymbomonas tetramitiformis TaxID=36881 RepID=A0AAE0BU55_9CHLO|nr:hypothetical protein CYMTET_47464 [Cymbomonas tetramitiformis]
MPPKPAAKNGKSPNKKAEESPEEKFGLEISRLEAEKQNLAVELAFQKDKLRTERSNNSKLEQEVATLKGRLGKATSDSDDILTHKQREIKLKMERVAALEAKVRQLQQQLEEQEAKVKLLQDTNNQNQKKLEESQKLFSEKIMLEDAVRRQDAIISKQEEELERLRKHVDEKEELLTSTRAEIEDLRLKASATTKLKILFGEPWMVTRTRHRLTGDVPADREENTINQMGSKLLVLYGGHMRGEATRDLAVANLETGVWEYTTSSTKSDPLGSGPRTGHASTAMGKNKMVVFGGRRPGVGLQSDVQLLNTDNMKWTQPAVKGAPPQREYHAAMTVRDKVYCFGGYSNNYHNDMFVLDFETMQWVTVTPYGQVPTARRCHSINVSEDGRKLWLFGGFDGQRTLNDLFIFEVDRQTWTSPAVTGLIPCAREAHTATIISKYLIISGGSDGHRRLCDTHILNTETMEWECLDDGQEGAASLQVLGLKPRAQYSCFQGTRLLTVRPNRDERLDELEVLEFSLPEDISGLRRQRTAGVEEDHGDRLELLDEVNSAPNAIEVMWRAPAKHADRIDRYKLMMATNTGVVKEVCQGKYERFKVTGLRANAEYIFCVKAIYDDGSHLWSESKAFSTRYSAKE